MACTDGGSTGCSLSLTSKFVAAACRPARFTTVSIAPRSHDDASLSQFLDCIIKERARAASTGSAAPRVRHLFLAACKSPPQDSDWSSREEETDPIDDRPRPPTFHENIDSLLELVAPDLHTLALISSRWGRLGLSPSLVHKPFPQLRELTVVDHFGQLGFAPVPLYGGPSQGSPENIREPTLYPRLERLSMLGTAHTMDLPRWSRRAPRLTHLRIAHLQEYVMESVINILQCRVKGASHDPRGANVNMRMLTLTLTAPHAFHQS